MYLKWKGFKHSQITPERPQANRTETVMTNTMKVIQTSELEGKDFKRKLKKIFPNYRATLHPSTGCTPAELLLNARQFCTRLSQVPAGGTYKPKLARQKDPDMKSKNKSYYDQQNCTKVSENK